MTRAKDISKIVTDANLSGTLDVTGTVTAGGLTVDGSVNVNTSGAGVITAGSDTSYFGVFPSGTYPAQFYLSGANRTGLESVAVLGSKSFQVKNHILNKNIATFDGTTGDISFYEDTGTTPKFFWDASTERLGIGTSSPTYKIESSGSSNTLKLVNGTTYDLRFVEQNSLSNIYSYGSLDLSINTRYSNNIRFKTNDTERMRIDNSGNVGIGTSSPAGQLHVNAANPNVYITCADTGQSDIMFGGTSDSDAGIIRYADNDDSFRFFTDNSERMRIDSSGNLLVGTTDSNLTDNTTGSGIVAQANGALVVAREANTPFYVNRTGTSDGTLVDFRADGGTVGSIGTNGGNLIVQGSTATGKTGIKFGGAEWIPQDTGANSDGGVDLGGSSYRFKDLYLSGGVYLGGTGSANFLDDYEEGAFDITITPETSGSITVTTGFNSLIYTKIGRIVHITGAVGLIGVSSPVGTYVTIAGLPFTIASLDEIQEYAGFATYYIDDSTSSRSLLPSLYFTGTSFRAYIDASTIQANDTFAFNFSYIAT